MSFLQKREQIIVAIRVCLAVVISFGVVISGTHWTDSHAHSHENSHAYSNPQAQYLITKSHTNSNNSEYAPTASSEPIAIQAQDSECPGHEDGSTCDCPHRCCLIGALAIGPYFFKQPPQSIFKLNYSNLVLSNFTDTLIRPPIHS